MFECLSSPVSLCSISVTCNVLRTDKFLGHKHIKRISGNKSVEKETNIRVYLVSTWVIQMFC